MASLKEIVKTYKDEIVDGIAWVTIYKEGRSWKIETAFPEEGSYDDGYEFYDYDHEAMKKAFETDKKAICINGYYCGFGKDFTAKEIEDKIFYFYTMRFNQLSDFLQCYMRKVLTSEPDNGSEVVHAAAFTNGKVHQDTICLRKFAEGILEDYRKIGYTDVRIVTPDEMEVLLLS